MAPLLGASNVCLQPRYCLWSTSIGSTSATRVPRHGIFSVSLTSCSIPRPGLGHSGSRATVIAAGQRRKLFQDGSDGNSSSSGSAEAGNSSSIQRQPQQQRARRQPDPGQVAAMRKRARLEAQVARMNLLARSGALSSSIVRDAVMKQLDKEVFNDAVDIVAASVPTLSRQIPNLEADWAEAEGFISGSAAARTTTGRAKAGTTGQAKSESAPLPMLMRPAARPQDDSSYQSLDDEEEDWSDILIPFDGWGADSPNSYDIFDDDDDDDGPDEPCSNKAVDGVAAAAAVIQQRINTPSFQAWLQEEQQRKAAAAAKAAAVDRAARAAAAAAGAPTFQWQQLQQQASDLLQAQQAHTLTRPVRPPGSGSGFRQGLGGFGGGLDDGDVALDPAYVAMSDVGLSPAELAALLQETGLSGNATAKPLHARVLQHRQYDSTARVVAGSLATAAAAAGQLKSPLLVRPSGRPRGSHLDAAQQQQREYWDAADAAATAAQQQEAARKALIAQLAAEPATTWQQQQQRPLQQAAQQQADISRLSAAAAESAQRLAAAVSKIGLAPKPVRSTGASEQAGAAAPVAVASSESSSSTGTAAAAAADTVMQVPEGEWIEDVSASAAAEAARKALIIKLAAEAAGGGASSSKGNQGQQQMRSKPAQAPAASAAIDISAAARVAAAVQNLGLAAKPARPWVGAKAPAAGTTAAASSAAISAEVGVAHEWLKDVDADAAAEAASTTLIAQLTADAAVSAGSMPQAQKGKQQQQQAPEQAAVHAAAARMAALVQNPGLVAKPARPSIAPPAPAGAPTTLTTHMSGRRSEHQRDKQQSNATQISVNNDKENNRRVRLPDKNESKRQSQSVVGEVRELAAAAHVEAARKALLAQLPAEAAAAATSSNTGVSSASVRLAGVVAADATDDEAPAAAMIAAAAKKKGLKRPPATPSGPAAAAARPGNLATNANSSVRQNKDKRSATPKATNPVGEAATTAAVRKGRLQAHRSTTNSSQHQPLVSLAKAGSNTAASAAAALQQKLAAAAAAAAASTAAAGQQTVQRPLPPPAAAGARPTMDKPSNQQQQQVRKHADQGRKHQQQQQQQQQPSASAGQLEQVPRSSIHPEGTDSNSTSTNRQQRRLPRTVSGDSLATAENLELTRTPTTALVTGVVEALNQKRLCFVVRLEELECVTLLPLTQVMPSQQKEVFEAARAAAKAARAEDQQQQQQQDLGEQCKPRLRIPANLVANAMRTWAGRRLDVIIATSRQPEYFAYDRLKADQGPLHQQEHRMLLEDEQQQQDLQEAAAGSNGQTSSQSGQATSQPGQTARESHQITDSEGGAHLQDAARAAANKAADATAADTMPVEKYVRCVAVATWPPADWSADKQQQLEAAVAAWQQQQQQSSAAEAGNGGSSSNSMLSPEALWAPSHGYDLSGWPQLSTAQRALWSACGALTADGWPCVAEVVGVHPAGCLIAEVSMENPLHPFHGAALAVPIKLTSPLMGLTQTAAAAAVQAVATTTLTSSPNKGVHLYEAAVPVWLGRYSMCIRQVRWKEGRLKRTLLQQLEQRQQRQDKGAESATAGTFTAVERWHMLVLGLYMQPYLQIPFQLAQRSLQPNKELPESMPEELYNDVRLITSSSDQKKEHGVSKLMRAAWKLLESQERHTDYVRERSKGGCALHDSGVADESSSSSSANDDVVNGNSNTGSSSGSSTAAGSKVWCPPSLLLGYQLGPNDNES